MPKVSVIIPMYNTGPYLPECLDSLLGQTLEDLEIVCVDDGSTDGSAETLAEYASRDARITVIHQANQGPSVARNSGIEVAQGEYLSFLDSDDLFEKATLRELYERATASALDVVYFGARPFCDDSTLQAKQSDFESYYSRTREYPGVRSGPELLTEMSENNDYRPAACFQFIRHDFFRSAGLSFYPGILHEDNLLTFLCALQAQRVEYTPKTYYQRRVRQNSIMTAEKGPANFKGFFVCYLEMLRFVTPREFDVRTSDAVAKLCSQMFHQALRVLRTLPQVDRDAITQIDSSPEALVACKLLIRQASDLRNVDKLKKQLKATERKLETIRTSRSYRMTRYLRRLFRSGK